MRGHEIPVMGTISKSRCSGYKDERGCGTLASYSGLLHLVEFGRNGQPLRTAVRKCPICNASTLPQEVTS